MPSQAMARTNPTRLPHRPHRAQRGALLLEALVAILIFTFGVLGVMGMQALAVQQTTDARYRTEAAALADELIGQMWAGNRNVDTLRTQFNTCFPTAGCPGYGAWFAKVQATLPQVSQTVNPPQVNVSNAPGSEGLVTIRIRWKQPSETGSDVRTYVTSARITQ